MKSAKKVKRIANKFIVLNRICYKIFNKIKETKRKKEEKKSTDFYFLILSKFSTTSKDHLVSRGVLNLLFKFFYGHSDS